MKRVIPLSALVLVLMSLAGCGLKGPLYFPPAEQPKAKSVQPTQPAAAQTRSHTQVSGGNASTSADSQ